jgi:hypothetical protein
MHINLLKDTFQSIFSQEKLDALFPPERSNEFFDALFGDPDEGAYDIRLAYDKAESNRLHFNLELHQRPGRCLACNLTHGLPKVFERHPIINIRGLVEQIDALINGHGSCSGWKLGKSYEISRQLHAVPLVIEIEF